MTKKIFKNFVAIVMAIAMVIFTMDVFTKTASAYENNASFTLRFVKGTPSSINQVSNEIVITASGAPYVTLICDSFITDAPSAYIKVVAYSNDKLFETNEVVFSSPGTYRMYYKETATPNLGTPVIIRVNIEGYSTSNYVYVLGSVKT